MKSIKSLAIAALATFALFGVSSCNSSDSPSEPLYEIDFTAADFTFNTSNYWADCYNPSAQDVTAGIFSFSHTAWADVWDGVSYPAWKGFCPSKVNDNKEYADNWTDHQWGCMPENPYNGIFFVGNSEATVSENPLDNNKCAVRMINYGAFCPKYAFVTNSSYTYYAAKNGTAFNQPFSSTDEFVLHVVGVRNGVMTADLKFALIAGGRYLTQWAAIDLGPLGTVDEVLFYVDSNQKNSYGLTVPSYFCMTGFGYSLPETPGVAD